MRLNNNNFYIMRHGPTCYQTTRKNYVYPREGSLTKAGLTKEGKDCVLKTAKKIKRLSISLIYASDFRRTKETAKIVAREIGLKDERLIFSSRLRDINLGIYHEKPKKEFYSDFPNFFDDFSQKPKGGESLYEASERMSSFVSELEEKHQGENILIISHGEPLWLLEGWVKRLKEKDLSEDGIKLNYIQPGELRKLN